MINTYLKTLWRMFRKHLTRFLSVLFMVLVAVGFISGIGSSSDKIYYSMTDYYKAQNVSDFIIKSKSSSGFTDEEIALIGNKYGEENISLGMSFELTETDDGGEEEITRLYFLDTDEWTVNVPELIEGDMPSDSTEVLAEAGDNVLKGYSVGDEVELEIYGFTVTVTVSGIVQSPLTFALDGEPSWSNPEDMEIPDDVGGINDLITLDNILYLSDSLLPFLPTGDIYVTIGDRALFDSFSSAYEKYVNAQTEVIYSLLGGEDSVRVLTLYDNYSFKSLKAYGDKVAAIGYVLMVGFLFVTILVVLSTMTRLLEEERAQIACLRTQGYSGIAIISKYIFFAMIATGLGGFGAYFVGLGLAYLIYFVFNFSFVMPVMSSAVPIVYYLITFSVIVVVTVGATALSGIKMMRENCADLLRPKPPRAGKKVIFERIPILWNRLSFKYKSTTRNVLRYKSRFIMTVVAVAFAMALVMAGLTVIDLSLFGTLDSPAILGIGFVVLVFAGLLTMVVIYTLTNINISERVRELATLKVLGYHDGEVAGYIYREVYIDTIVGIIFGYPLSALLSLLVLTVIGMGTLGGISWFMWIIAPFVVLTFTALVTIVLRPKVVKIDMNNSLKAIE